MSLIRADFRRSTEKLMKIVRNIEDTGTFIQQNSIFKMMVEGTIIQIKGSHRRHHMIYQNLLGMHKARSIFINSDSCPQEPRIVRPADGINKGLVRDSRKDNPHIYPSLCRKTQSPAHLIGNNQIGSCYVNAFRGGLNHIQIDVLTQGKAVSGRIGIGRAIALTGITIPVSRQIIVKSPHRTIVHGMPHLQEKQG